MTRKLHADPPSALPSHHVRPHLTCEPCDYRAAGWVALFWPRWRWEQQAQRRFIFELCVMTRKYRVCFLSLSPDDLFPASRTLVHFDSAAAGKRGGLDGASQDSTASLTHREFCFYWHLSSSPFTFLKSNLATTADLVVAQESQGRSTQLPCI